MRMYVDLMKIGGQSTISDSGERVNVSMYECLCGRGRVGSRTVMSSTFVEPQWVINCDHCAKRWQFEKAIGLRGWIFTRRDGVSANENQIQDDAAEDSSPASATSGGSGDSGPTTEFEHLFNTEASTSTSSSSGDGGVVVEIEDDDMPVILDDEEYEDDDYPDEDIYGSLDMPVSDYGEPDDDDDFGMGGP